MAGLDELYAQGLRLRTLIDAQQQEKMIKQTQLEQYMHERIADNLRTTPEYATAMDKLMSPDTPSSELGKWAAQVGPDVMKGLQTRNGAILARQKLQADLVQPTQVGEAFRAVNHPLTPEQMPTAPMERSTLNAALSAFQSGANTQIREQGAMARTGAVQAGETNRNNARITAGQEKDAEANALKRISLGLQERRVKATEAGNKVAADRLALAEKRFNSGEVKTFADMRNLALQYISGPDEPSEEQRALANQVAIDAYDDVQTGVTPGQALSSSFDRNGVEPGISGGKAEKATAAAKANKKRGPMAENPMATTTQPPPTQAPQASQLTVEQILKEAGLEDTPENRTLAKKLYGGGK